LSEFARLKDVIIAVRDDEMGHRDVNHDYVKQIDDKKKIKIIKEDSLRIKEKSN
jgi:HD superfamily phosphohydrolase YqeK